MHPFVSSTTYLLHARHSNLYYCSTPGCFGVTVETSKHRESTDHNTYEHVWISHCGCDAKIRGNLISTWMAASLRSTVYRSALMVIIYIKLNWWRLVGNYLGQSIFLTCVHVFCGGGLVLCRMDKLSTTVEMAVDDDRFNSWSWSWKFVLWSNE